MQEEKIKLFYNIIKQLSKNITLNEFIKIIKDSPFHYSHSLASLDLYTKTFGHAYFYQLEIIIRDFVNTRKTDTKKELYNQINNIINIYKNYINQDLTNEKINNLIHEYILSDVEARQSLLPKDIIELVNNIYITDANKIIYQLIIDEFNDRKNFYINKIKSLINSTLEYNMINSISNKPDIYSLKELKNLNNIGKIFNIDTKLIDEINDSVKDKFIWFNGEYIDSSMGYGMHHGQMVINKIRELRGEQIDDKEKLYISNSREPEDLSIKTTEEENKIPIAFIKLL